MLAKQQTPELAVQMKNCDELEKGAQTQCFVEDILAQAKNIGITPAIEKAKEYLAVSPSLQNECHGIMHSLGEEGYKLYKEGVALDINESIIMCTYGFYHGFINAAVLEEGSFAPAQAFCTYINAELSKQGIEAQSECYHGFGHAVVDDHVSTQFQNGQEVVKQALELCMTLSPGFEEYVNCGSGVYNAVANIFLDNSFTWPEIENEDPLVFCGSQPEDLMVTCYGYFARVLFGSKEGNLQEALASIKTLVEPEYQVGIIENVALMATLTNPDKSDFESYIASCKTLDVSVQGKCIGGLASGIGQSAQTDHLFETASAVCTSVSVDQSEKMQCYESLLMNIRTLITKKELDAICNEFFLGTALTVCTS